MSLNQTVSAERVHIGFFGLRNAGKSSLVNAVTGQNLSLVSSVLGTTTDPVQKAMELLPMGPVVIIDTPGLDDQGELGQMRVERAKAVLSKIHVAILVVDGKKGLSDLDRELLAELEARKLPHIIAYNKSDLLDAVPAPSLGKIWVSAEKGTNIHELKDMIAALSKSAKSERKLLADIVDGGDTVVLVIPIDESAPKGRLILPQQTTIRELLEIGATVVACRDTELPETLKKLRNPPKLVITDSQAFGRVSKMVPKEIMLTSFSILFARYKGDLATVVRGAAMLDRLRAGDRILISEGCTHHRQCNDIGSVKIPGWIRNYTGKDFEFCFTSGGEFPADPSGYALVVHCGGCMLNEKEMASRLARASAKEVPMTNYGIAIAMMHGILARSLEPFPEILEILK